MLRLLLGRGNSSSNSSSSSNNNSDNSDGQTFAFLSCTERSYTTLGVFEDSMSAAGLAFEVGSKGCYSPTESVLNSDVQHQVKMVFLL